MTPPRPIRWNIFARELEDILGVHHLRLGHLDDLGVVLQREKVRRLQHSLRSPAHFPTLNPDEIDRLFVVVQFTPLEQSRIRAALLATAVERILMDRIDPQTALMAADDVFNILLAAMHAQPASALASIKAGAPTDEAAQSGDAEFEEALDLIDRATLDLHLSREATTLQAQKAHAHEAAERFARAEALLQHTQTPAPGTHEWRAWDQEAQSGLLAANSLIQQAEQEEP